MTGAPGPAVTPARARRARVSVSALFLVNGALVATILPRLPAIKDALDLSNAELGGAVAAMPLGGLLAGGLAGVLIHRVGSGRLAAVTGVASALLLAGVGLAPGWAALALVFLLLGTLDATMDAAQNAHALGVRRAYGRSILHAFHGYWSAGGILGGVTGALAAGLAVPVPLHLGVVGGVLVVATLVAWRGLLPDRVADAPDPAAAPADPVHLRAAPRLLGALGPLAVLGLLSVMLEDAASTWSAVYLVETLGVGAGAAGTAFVLYAACMTLGRLTNDRWVDRWGDVAVARLGAVVAAGGLVAVVGAGVLGIPPLAWLGFAAVGIGASSLFPIMVDAAGARPGIPAAHAVAIVSWLARLGSVLAPALVGLAADRVGLAAAFAIPLAAAAMLAVLAPRLLRAGGGGRLARTAG